MKSDQSVPLSEALQHFSDPNDWEEFRSLERYDLPLFFAGGPETETDRLGRRCRQLRARLEAELLAKLTAGALQASGLVWPIGLNPKRRLISAARWYHLEPDFGASEANGGGLRIVDVRVQKPRPARARLSHPSAAEEHAQREHASLARLRTDLRRWLQQEARQRGTSWSKKLYCSAARTRFGDRVSNNLFNEVWRSADLPAALRRPGLRKADHHLSGSSPPG